jgi:hypothetical protein
MTGRNVTEQERQYHIQIQELARTVDPELIRTAPFLFSSRVSVQSVITRLEMYKRILDIPGCIIEYGVFQGNSFAFLAHLSVILEPYAINRQIIGFDSFAGFRSISPGLDPDDVSEETFSNTSQEILAEAIRLIDDCRPVNRVERFKLVPGDIVETVPRFAADNPWLSCALLILDSDLYLPTRVALETFLPRMNSGSVVVFDEFNYSNFSGESLAIREVVAKRQLRIQKLPYESCSAFAVVE